MPPIITTPAVVYVSRYESNGTKGVAKYWKDGVAVSLTDGTKNAYTNTVLCRVQMYMREVMKTTVQKM
jgi:hypothetical protein